MVVIKLNLKILSVNHDLCKILDFSEKEIKERGIQGITYSNDIKRDLKLGKQMLNDEIPFFCLQKRFIKKNGELIWKYLLAFPIRDEHGTPLYGLGIVEDIFKSERKNSCIENRPHSHMKV